MNTRQKYRLNMFRNVINVCSAHPELAVRNPGFIRSIGELQKVVGEIDQLSASQSVYNARLTPDVQALYQRLTEVALAIGGAMYVYASGNNDHSLKNLVNLRPSDFKRITQKKCIEICTQLLEETKKKALIMADFGVTAEAIREFEKLLAAYKDQHTRPKKMVESRSEATRMLEKAFLNGNKLLKEETDRLARYYKLNVPEFYQVYREARKNGIAPETSPAGIKLTKQLNIL